MFLNNTVWIAGLDAGLGAAFYAFSAADAPLCDLIALGCNAAVSKKIAFSENRVDAEIEVFYSGVPDFENDAYFPRVFRINVGKVGLFLKNCVDIFALFFRCCGNSLRGEPYHLFVFCAAQDLYSPVAQKLAAEGLSPGGKKVNQGFEYNSGNNTEWLSVEDLKELLAKTNYIH